MNIKNKVNAFELEDSLSLSDSVLFPDLRKKYWCSYESPKSIFELIKLIGNSVYNSNYKKLKKEFQKSRAFENAYNVLEILPSGDAAKYLNQLIKYVGKKGKEKEFVEVVGQLAKENPNAEFYVNCSEIESAERAYSQLKNQGIENVKPADATREFRKNLLEWGGFGVVAESLPDKLNKNIFNYSINRNKLRHTDPFWNESRYRSSDRDCVDNQHNFLAHQVFDGWPAIAISGNSFYASDIINSKKQKNFAEKIFNYLFLSRENIETPLPGKNVTEKHIKKVYKNLREFKADNELINGTFISYAVKNF